MRRIAASLLLIALLPLRAGAEADGPDYWAVSGLRQNARLGVHAAPKANARLVGNIPSDGRGLRNLGCTGSASFADWLKMHGAARRAAAGRRWCHIRYREMEGWVRGKFLVEDAEAPLLRK